MRGPGEGHESNLPQAMVLAARFSEWGVMFAVPPLAGAFVDRWLKTSPFLLILGSLVGLFLGMSRAFAYANQVSAKPPAPKPPSDRGPGGLTETPLDHE